MLGVNKTKILTEYKNIPLQSIPVNDVSFGYRQIGKGEDLVFIHGFPTHGYTWRKILPKLSKYFKCHILDMPGLGDSDWSRNSNLNIDIQAKNAFHLLYEMGIKKFSLIAHDSGGTIARIMAIKHQNEINNLILINTEIPTHRPPFIELYQRVSRLPFSSYYFQNKLSQIRFVKSSMGFRHAYSDRKMLDNDENLGPYLNPLIKSNRKIKGAFKFLRGIDWKLIDEFYRTHAKIKANVLFIWGKNDKTFPIELGIEMAKQFESKLEFRTIENASLLPHEEKPEMVSDEIIKFMIMNPTCL